MMLSIEQAREAVSQAHAFFGLSCSLDDFENAFFLTDHLLHQGFVSIRPHSQVGKLVYDAAMEWYSFFHGLLIPNPQSMLMMRESNALPDELKEELTTQMELLARYHRMGQYANMTHSPDQFKEAVRAIVDLRFSSLAETFAKVQLSLDTEWSSPRREEADLRSYG